MFAAINCTLVSDGDGSSSSSTRLERLAVLAGDLLSFLGVAHFRGLGVLRLGTKVLLTILKRTRDYFKFGVTAFSRKVLIGNIYLRLLL